MSLSETFQWPPKPVFTKDPIPYLDEAYANTAKEVNRPGWRHAGQAAVTGGATAVVVTEPFDRLPIYITATPNWDTTVFIVARGTTGFTLNFGTAAPGGGGTADWLAVEPDQGP